MDFENLPDGWELVTIEDIADYVQRGKQPKYIEYSELPVINQKAVRWDKVEKEFLKYVHPSQWDKWTEERFVQEGDILWNSTGTGTVGRAAIFSALKDIEKIVVDSHVTIVRIKQCDSKYVHFWIMSPTIQSKIESMHSGSTNQVELSKTEVLKTLVPLPPLNEQKRIVEKIDRLNIHSSRAREALEDVPKLIEQFRQSVLAAAFRGDLTADWRKQNPDVEPASVLLERIKTERRQKWEEAELAKMRAKGKEPKNDKWKFRYKETDDLDDFEYPTLPTTWEWTTLTIACSKITDGEHITSPTVLDGIPLLSAKDVRNGFLDFSKTKYMDSDVAQKSRQRCNPEREDILVVSRGATVGRSCLIKTDKVFCLMGSVLLFKIYSNYILPEIIDFFMKSPLGIKKLISTSGASAQQAIYIRDIKKFLIPIPPLDEQKEIVQKIHDFFILISRIEAEFSNSESEINKLEQSILAKAFRGELVPQDPDDEPASVLLERIRVEQEKLKPKKKKRKTTRRKKEPTQLELDGIG